MKAEKHRKCKSKRLNIPVKPFHLKPVRKRMAKLKCSTSCLHIFSTFSSNFLQVFQMTKLNCFHHRSTNVCKNTVKVRPLFAPMNSCCAKWVNQLHDFCVNRSCTCCGNVLETSRIASRLCVCVCVCVCACAC